jgi:hypothetical protein
MLMKNFISFSFSDVKETEISEENTIYLFDFEPNIRDFPAPHVHFYFFGILF